MVAARCMSRFCTRGQTPLGARWAAFVASLHRGVRPRHTNPPRCERRSIGVTSQKPTSTMRLLIALVSVVALNREVPAKLEPVSVELKTFQFTPDTLRVSVGATVRWTNQDEIEHTVTAGSPSERDVSFNATLAKKGAAAERTFERAGTFTYFCDRHQFMRGTITVTR